MTGQERAPAQDVGSHASGDEHAGRFCAVVYVHGMGSQRRYEEVSRLVEAIDIYLHNSREARATNLGYLFNIRPRLEPLRGDPDRTIAYIRASHRPGKQSAEPARQARFYEVYWAPVLAGHGGLRDIVFWLFGQVRRPFATARSPWRERQRLRRSTLIQILESNTRWPADITAADFQDLLEEYDKFEGHERLRQYPKGRFADFLACLADRYSSDVPKARRLACLAQAWKTRYVWAEVLAAFQMVTIAVALALVALLSAGLALMVLQTIVDSSLYARLESRLPGALNEVIQPSWSSAAGLAATLSTLLGLSGFVTRYMGDVQAWTTYEETDEKHELRRKIIDAGVETLAHVLTDEKCERVVIVSHSLGTSVAHDTLLAVARLNRASPDHRQDPMAGPLPLGKISHFITFASPIDKVEYLFESYQSRSHRFKRVVEELRGDIGDVPFTRNRKPFIHWVNYWDEGDIISGALSSPCARSTIVNRVDNVHVRNFLFPAPAASHAGYFAHRTVIGDLFAMIYNNDYAFANAQARHGGPKDYASVYREPGEGRGWARVAYAAAGVLVYAGALHAIALVFEIPGVRVLTLPLIGLTAAALIAGYLASSLRGHRHKI